MTPHASRRPVGAAMSAHSLKGGVPGTGKLLYGHGNQRAGGRIGPGEGVTTDDADPGQRDAPAPGAVRRAGGCAEHLEQLPRVLRPVRDDEARLALAEQQGAGLWRLERERRVDRQVAP